MAWFSAVKAHGMVIETGSENECWVGTIGDIVGYEDLVANQVVSFIKVFDEGNTCLAKNVKVLGRLFFYINFCHSCPAPSRPCNYRTRN